MPDVLECDWCPNQPKSLRILDYHGTKRHVCEECYDNWINLSDAAKEIHSALADLDAWPEEVECECGGTTAGTTHSHWCPVK